MTASNDIQARAEEVQLLIASDRVLDAVNRLMDFVTDFSTDRHQRQEVIIIKNNYHRIEKFQRAGVQSLDDTERRRNMLLYQALALLDSVEEQCALSIAS